jgi:hypothetical protein
VYFIFNKEKKMRSSKSSFLTKKRVKICRSVTVYDALPDGEGSSHKYDRAFSTTQMNNEEG